MIGKRFLFGIVSVICTTIAAIKLGFDGDTYLKVISAISGLYIAGQTITDSVSRRKE